MSDPRTATRDPGDVEKDLQAYQMLLDLWSQENPIKTNKLQVLLAVNGLLVSAATVANGQTDARIPLFVAGVVFNLVWLLSIGRTSLYQELWQAKLERLAAAHPDDPRFQVRVVDPRDASPFLRRIGGVSSKWYLVGTPIALALAWLGLLAWAWICCGRA